MARGNTILILAGCLLLAAASTALATSANVEVLTFYMHFDTVGLVFGPAQQEKFLSETSSDFGRGYVFDDLLTDGADETSTEIGRARGIFIYSARDSSTNSNEQIFTIKFTGNSQYSGSTLSVQGLWLEIDAKAEFSIVGGTGEFRFSMGSLILDPVDSNSYEVTATILNFDVNYMKDPRAK